MNDLKDPKAWLNYANDDLLVAKMCFNEMHPRQTEISSYHCQQCAEKSLKAYLYYQKADPPHIHNLIELCQLCGDYDKTFLDLQFDCADLNPIGGKQHYPTEVAPTDEIAAAALSKAEKVYNFCLDKCREPSKEENKVQEEPQ
jgi:HEPN domain-containing protein